MKLIRELTIRSLKEAKMEYGRHVDSVTISVNNKIYIEKAKQVCFDNIQSDNIVISFIIVADYLAPIYVYTLDKAMQIEYRCIKNNKDISKFINSIPVEEI